jgi:RNA polymerase sigma factor (sigma-70 family)
MTFYSKSKLMQEVNLKNLYRKWPIVRRELRILGCQGSVAEDIFQEALLILCRKIEDPNFVLDVEAIHFVKSTCKYLWFNQARKAQKQQTVELNQEVAQIDEDWLEKEEKLTSIEEAILKLGKQCQQILTLFYSKSLSMEKIAQRVGLRNEKVAKAQKYRCIQKVKELIQHGKS